MSSVSYPAAGPSVFDRSLRVTPPVEAAGACADASVATKPVMAQSAQDAKPAKPRRVSMASSLPFRSVLVRTSVIEA
jgi:hypothetical protein